MKLEEENRSWQQYSFERKSKNAIMSQFLATSIAAMFNGLIRCSQEFESEQM